MPLALIQRMLVFPRSQLRRLLRERASVLGPRKRPRFRLVSEAQFLAGEIGERPRIGRYLDGQLVQVQVPEDPVHRAQTNGLLVLERPVEEHEMALRVHPIPYLI
jgi:hypothetical protein